MTYDPYNYTFSTTRDWHEQLDEAEKAIQRLYELHFAMKSIEWHLPISLLSYEPENECYYAPEPGDHCFAQEVKSILEADDIAGIVASRKKGWFKAFPGLKYKHNCRVKHCLNSGNERATIWSGYEADQS